MTAVTEKTTDASIRCADLVRIFTADGVEVQALQGLTLRVDSGELVRFAAQIARVRLLQQLGKRRGEVERGDQASLLADQPAAQSDRFARCGERVRAVLKRRKPFGSQML